MSAPKKLKVTLVKSTASAKQDHRATVGLLIEELAQRMLDLILDERPIRSMAIQTDE